MQRFFRAPVFHMLWVDIRHNRNGRRQAVEGAVTFVGLHHHPFALPHPRVGAVGMDDPAVDHGRVNATFVQKCCHHRCRRCLAMGTRNGNV